MAKPILEINGHDYAEYVEELSLSINDMDAEGSGRDVKTGLMYRTRVASKLKAEVKMANMSQALAQQLKADLTPVYYSAKVLNPVSGEQETKTFYTSTIPFGAQRYDKETGAPYYSGLSFSMIER